MNDPEITAEQAWQFQADHMEAGKLVIWTVYDHPRDYPDWFVARPFVMPVTIADPMHGHLKAATLWGLRDLLPLGLTCLYAADGDDPVIIESWL